MTTSQKRVPAAPIQDDGLIPSNEYIPLTAPAGPIMDSHPKEMNLAFAVRTSPAFSLNISNVK
jgi:hypothetical protein